MHFTVIKSLVHLKNPTYIISPIALFSSGLKTVVKRQQNWRAKHETQIVRIQKNLNMYTLLAESMTESRKVHNKNLTISSSTTSMWKLSCCCCGCYNLALLKLSSEARIQSSDLRLFAISMTKRYFTSALPSLSIAVLMYEMGIFSIKQVILCSPQKSSISCVSLIPPIPLPPTYRRAGSHKSKDIQI